MRVDSPDSPVSLVKRACGALHAAAQAQPTASASEIADEIAEAWTQVPLRVGVRGDAESRLQLFVAAAGNALVDAETRGTPAPTLRLQRTTVARYVATYTDGTVEQVFAPAIATPQGTPARDDPSPITGSVPVRAARLVGRGADLEDGLDAATVRVGQSTLARLTQGNDRSTVTLLPSDLHEMLDGMDESRPHAAPAKVSGPPLVPAAAAFASGSPVPAASPTPPATRTVDPATIVPVAADIAAPVSAMAANPAADIAVPASAMAANVLDTRPRYVRQKPPWWAIWAWVARWIYIATHRAPAPAARAIAVAASAAPVDDAVVDASGPVPIADDLDRQTVRGLGLVPARAYALKLAGLVSGSAGQGVREVAIDVAGGLLPAGVELVELADDAPGIAMDLVIAVKQQIVYVVEIRDERVQRIGTLEHAVPELVVLAARGRAYRLAWRAVEILRSLEATLGDIIASADARFRGRIAEIEALHVDDAPAVIAERMALLRPEVMARASAIVKHVLAEVGADLDRVDIAWTDVLTEATTIEQLQAAVAKIDRASPAALDEIAGDARRLLASSLAGAVFDLLPIAGQPVRDRGLSEDRLRDLANRPPPAIAVMPKLLEANGTNLGAVAGNWLTNLFASFDARRSDMLARLRARIGQLRELAMAEMLDIEPRLYTALGEAAEALVTGALERHASWLDERLTAERAAITAEREAMRPMIRARDGAHDDARDLASAMTG